MLRNLSVATANTQSLIKVTQGIKNDWVYLMNYNFRNCFKLKLNLINILQFVNISKFELIFSKKNIKKNIY